MITQGYMDPFLGKCIHGKRGANYVANAGMISPFCPECQRTLTKEEAPAVNK